jgi:hypothetical protein
METRPGRPGFLGLKRPRGRSYFASGRSHFAAAPAVRASTSRTADRVSEWVAGVYLKLTGSRSRRGLRKWLAGVAGVDVRTAGRWLNGERRIPDPVRRQLEELARSASPRERVIIGDVLDELDRAAVRLLEDAEEERRRRLLSDPFAFDTWEDFRAYRRRYGLRTRRERDAGRWLS